MADPLIRLNTLSLLEFPNLFSSLTPPAQESLRGRYRGAFVGPAWLRQMAGPLLVITGLGGWWGKDFGSEDNAINLVQRAGDLKRCLPMRHTIQASLIDGKPALVLHYSRENPFPWPWIVDELRIFKPGILLGMTIACLGPLKHLALPFALQPQETSDGF